VSARARTGDGGPDVESAKALSGLALILWEIDAETLPDDNDRFPEEVRRRVAAAREGVDGWRTGELATTLDDYGGEEER
jgi:hypothetical protein